MWDNMGRTFFTVIIDYGLIFRPEAMFQIKTVEWWIYFLQKVHKMLIDGLESFGLLMDYCDVFIRSLDSHSDGTHSLQIIHWWVSDGMLNFSKSVPTKKQTICPRLNKLSANLGGLFPICSLFCDKLMDF